MKRITYILLAAVVLAGSCAKDYDRKIVGRWNAGKATLNSDIMVTVRADATITAQITNTDMKPVNASYTINRDRFIIIFPSYSLSYRILSIDDKKMVMKSRFGRITWNRLE